MSIVQQEMTHLFTIENDAVNPHIYKLKKNHTKPIQINELI